MPNLNVITINQTHLSRVIIAKELQHKQQHNPEKETLQSLKEFKTWRKYIQRQGQKKNNLLSLTVQYV